MTDEEVMSLISGRAGWRDILYSSVWEQWYGSHPDFGEGRKASKERAARRKAERWAAAREGRVVV